MKKFNTFIIAITFFLLGGGGILNAQTLEFTGEVLWKSQGTGVYDHSMTVDFGVNLGFGGYGPENFEFTSCATDDIAYVDEPVAGYGNVTLSTLGDLNVFVYNEMTGQSVNSDYREGVSTIDLVKIERHILGTELFEDYTTSDDAPYNLVSADVDNDHGVDYDDHELVRKIVLNISIPTYRESFEWFRDKTTQTALDFYTNPYDYALSEGGINKMRYDDITANDINGNQFFYYGIRTTKVGDINNSTVQNCQGIYSLVEFENDDNENSALYKKGEKINLNIDVKSDNILEAFQLPLAINESKFKIIDVNYPDDNFIYHSNRIDDQEYLCIGYLNHKSKNKINNDSYSFDIILELNEDMYLNDNSFTSKKFRDPVEIISDGKYTNGKVIAQVHKLPELTLRYGHDNLFISGIDERARTLLIKYYSFDGILLNSEEVNVLNRESITYNSPKLNGTKGVIITSVKNLYQDKTIKIIK